MIIEIVEAVASDSQALEQAVTEVRRRGARIAVDDAGSGYSGLLRLSTLHPDLIKIDRSVVAGSGDNEVQLIVIEALVNFAHRIGARVLGEGVETPDDLRTLVDLGVDWAQGWAIAHPTPNLPTQPTLPQAPRRRTSRQFRTGIRPGREVSEDANLT